MLKEMKVLDHFSIPYIGLKSGPHTFHFEIDDRFFTCFDNALISKGEFKAELLLDKRPDMSIADISVSGFATVSCDRCLMEFNLPLHSSCKMHVKYGEPSDNDDEVIYIAHETSHVNFAQPIYEIIILALPLIKTHIEISDCDQNIIAKLSNRLDDDTDQNETWNALKNIKLN